ncbi:hypothetical protein EXE52_17635 [Halorubrum sp. CGM4_25_10-8A]|nr:hypothetical protein EXE52_17635 [Halorubrum sp. CGM4_25_10-8A]TKX61521.1 hypothetical protein EXE47_17540 [Halorubrum sp. GN12_10-3_MGM]
MLGSKSPVLRLLHRYSVLTPPSNWDVDNDDIIECLRNLADVVDSEKSVDEVGEVWEGRDVNILLC